LRGCASFASVQAALPGSAPTVRADRVGRFGQEAERGAGLLGDPLCERVQLRELRVTHGGVAEQHRAAFADSSDCATAWAAADAVTPASARAARRRAVARPPRRCRPVRRASRRCGDDALRGRDQRVVAGCVQEVQLGAVLRGLTQACGEQRVVLAQERADDQRHQVRQIGDRHAEPRRTGDRRREIGWRRRKSTFVAAVHGELLHEEQLFGVLCARERAQRVAP
jgi:hypothetical protein